MEERRCSNCLSLDIVFGTQVDTYFKPGDQDMITIAGFGFTRVLSGRMGQVATACRKCGHIDLWIDMDSDQI